jgi:hypothetical protein
MRFIEAIRAPRPERKPYDPYLDAAAELLSDEPAFETELCEAEAAALTDAPTEPVAFLEAQPERAQSAPAATEVQTDSSADVSSQPEPGPAPADSEH